MLFKRSMPPRMSRWRIGRSMAPKSSRWRILPLWLSLAASLVCHSPAVASENGRLLATGGAVPLDGAAGGGIVPWAMLSGYSTNTEHGFTAAVTAVSSDDYELRSFAASWNFRNRVEVSAATQSFDIGVLSGALGFDPGELEQDIVGVKLRLSGDVVYSRAPQVSVGLLSKRNDTFTIPAAVGARSDSGTEFYVAAAKAWLAGLFGRTTLVNLTMRSSNANQTGLLGFGGDLRNSRSVLTEVAAAVFVNRRLAVGFEYREKPNNLSFATEDNWYDLFVAFFPNKRFSVVGAFADLGSIAGIEGQNAFYVSVQGTFE